MLGLLAWMLSSIALTVAAVNLIPGIEYHRGPVAFTFVGFFVGREVNGWCDRRPRLRRWNELDFWNRDSH